MSSRYLTYVHEEGKGRERERRGEREGGEEEALCCSFIKWNLKLSKYCNIQVFVCQNKTKKCLQTSITCTCTCVMQMVVMGTDVGDTICTVLPDP